MLKSKGKMRGIYLRGDVFWFTKQVNGRRSHVSLETKDYAEAVQRATEVADRPELQPSRAMDSEIQRFIEYKLRSNRYSPASADSKRYILQEFADTLGNVSPGQVTAFHCKAFYKRMKERVSPSTAESYMFTLRSFFQWCVSDNLCRRNPAMEVEMDRVDHQARIKFTDLELAQKLIANAPNDDMRFILFCGFHVGMRKQEIIEAIPEWFNLTRKTLEIRATATFRPKDRDARTVPLTDQFAEFPAKLRIAKAFRAQARGGAREVSLSVRFPASVHRIHGRARRAVDHAARYAAFVRLHLRDEGDRHLPNCNLARRRRACGAETLCKAAPRRPGNHARVQSLNAKLTISLRPFWEAHRQL